MPIALAGTPNTVKTGPSNNLVTPAIDSTGADMIIVPIVAADALVYVQPIDNFSNTYHPIPNGPIGEIVRNSFASSRLGMSHVLNPTVGSGHTWTIAQPNTFLQAGIIPVCFSGVGSFEGTEFRRIQLSGSTATTSHQIHDASITPPSGGCLIVSAFAPTQTTAPGTVTPPAGMTLINSIPQSSGTYQLYVAYEIQEAPVTRDHIWTTTNSVIGIGLSKIFLPADGGPGGGGSAIQLVHPRQQTFLSFAQRRS